MDLTFTQILDFIGTFAFAVSGIRRASGKQIDLFGAYILGLVTATGGGTVRDLLLGVTPFWMTDFKYFTTTGIAFVAVLLFKNRLFKWGSTLFIFDTIGLGIFTVIGITKSIDAGLPYWVCILMGMITGSLGGVLRDILLNEVPMLFRKDIYALACVAGGAVYFICVYFDVHIVLTETLAVAAVIILRILAVRYSLQLPHLYASENKDEEKERDP